MSAVAIDGAVAARKKREPPERRTFQRVRRDSPQAGGAWEADWTRVQDEKALGNVTRAVEAYLRHRRELQREQKGRYRPLPALAEKILRLIVDMKTSTGVFTMSAKAISYALGISMSCVYASLKLLADIGVIEWTRRSQKTGELGTRGAGYKQASNIYRLCEMPRHIAEMFKGYFRKPPPTPEEAAAAARQAAEIQRTEDRRRQTDWTEMKAKHPALARAEAKAQAAAFAEFFATSALGGLLGRQTPS